MVKVKLGSAVMVGVSRSGGGVVRQENSEGYIVVSKVSSAACRSRLPSILIDFYVCELSFGKKQSMMKQLLPRKMVEARAGCCLVAEVTLFQQAHVRKHRVFLSLCTLSSTHSPQTCLDQNRKGLGSHSCAAIVSATLPTRPQFTFSSQLHHELDTRGHASPCCA